MKNILIVGGGFGGLVTAENLADSLGKDAHITVVAPNETFTFYPSLVELAFGACEPEDISFDLRSKLKEMDVRFVRGKVTSINTRRRSAEVAGADFRGEIAYDYLVAAPGRRLATEKITGFFKYAHHLLGTSAALKFGEAVDNFKQGTIVVGLCPGGRLPVPVCETAFALSRKFDSKIREGKIVVKVIFPESLQEAFGGADLYKELEAALRSHNIQVLYGVPINEITEHEILSGKKHRIHYDLQMLVPPFGGQRLINQSGITDEDDFIRVDANMRVQGLENTYAVGDIVAFTGPKFAHMAVRQATVAAENIVSEINGNEPAAEYYHEINTIIDSGDADTFHLRYGIWDDTTFSLRRGTLWSWAKSVHAKFWKAKHN